MANPSDDPANATTLSALFDNALKKMPCPSDETSSSDGTDGILYSGNRHESVPRALLLDKRLTPLERNAWQVFRLQLNPDGLTAFPTYDQLRPYLASMPCTPNASHETVARALTVLRLSRWLSLVRRQRDPKTGRIKGNLYVLHDEPLTPYEAMQLDPDYLELVSQALSHASKAIQRVGCQVLQDVTEDPLLQGRLLPTRLQVLARRMVEAAPVGYPQDKTHESEEGDHTLLRNREWRTSESEAGVTASKTHSLRNPKQDRTNVLSNRIYSVRTVPRARELQNLRLPERFLGLNREQQAGALAALRQVPADQRQAVLDEWTVRCCDGTIRNPAGYLFGIIQKAIRGEFKAWAWPGDSTITTAPPGDPVITPRPDPDSNTPNPHAVEARLEALYSLLHKT